MSLKKFLWGNESTSRVNQNLLTRRCLKSHSPPALFSATGEMRAGGERSGEKALEKAPLIADTEAGSLEAYFKAHA